MYDFLVLPEFNESPAEFELGYDNSNVVNAFPDQLTQNEVQSGVPNSFVASATPATASAAPATVNPVDTDLFASDPYYTYDSNSMAIDDMVFPSMLSPSMSSEGTSPTVPSSDSLFDQAYDFELETKPVTQTQTQTQTHGDFNSVMQAQIQPQPQTHTRSQSLGHTKDELDLDSLMSMPLHQPIHMSPIQTSPIQTSPMEVSPITCQPTPVHSRSQSYSLPFESAPPTHALQGHIQSNHTHTHNHSNHHAHNHIHHSHDHNHSHADSPESDVCESDEEEEELSLDDSPSAHGVLFKNLSQDEQTKYRKYHCPVCKKYFRRDLPRHLRIHQRVARFVCPYPRDQCSHKRGQFNRPYDYKKHLLHSHFQFDEAKLVRGFRDLKSKLSHFGTCNCGRRFRADKWLDDHVMKCLKEMN